MKKFFLLSIAIVVAFCLKAQNYDAIKNTLILNSTAAYKKAKEDVDKGMANAKFASKAEAYLLKATIYGNMAMDSAVRATPEGDRLRTEAEMAFTKYREMDPGMALVVDPIYRNGPINIYSSLFSAGYKDYENKNWQAGFEKYKKVVELSDIMIAKQLIPVTVDTNSLILAGATAENAGLKDEAVKYYGRLADLKASGAGLEIVYRFLVTYYATKKDTPNFEKYRALGKELYPKNEYFTYDKVDFAVGLEDDFNKKVQALEETMAADPSNVKATTTLVQILYDTLNPRSETAVMPANMDELEAKMVKALTKATALEPQNEMMYIYSGNHFWNKSVRANDAREAHVAAMKARTKPGTQASKDDIQKREGLDAKYGEALEAAREPYEKAAELYAKKTTLSGQDKQRYKNVVGYLGDIYTYKKNHAKGKPADVAKFTAEERKWNDLYGTIK